MTTVARRSTSIPATDPVDPIEARKRHIYAFAAVAAASVGVAVPALSDEIQALAHLAHNKDAAILDATRLRAIYEIAAKEAEAGKDTFGNKFTRDMTAKAAALAARVLAYVESWDLPQPTAPGGSS